jgi:FixJ family two-component response regulator
MPEMSGPDLRDHLARSGQRIPTIFITARTDDTVRRDLLGRGASECLFKPFSEQDLREALGTALGNP